MSRIRLAPQCSGRSTILLIGLAALLIIVARATSAEDTATHRAYLPIAAGKPGFGVAPLGSGFNQVTEVTHAGDDRLFVAERAGVVKVLHPDGHVTTFLDIRNRVISHSGEYGFFDVAFHPGYSDPSSPGHGYFYVSYTTGSDDGVIINVHFVVSRFRVSADPNVADPASEVILQYEKQSFNVHKGGGMEFDPRDNMLYVGMGDDRLLLIAQSDNSPKGKISRLDVDEVDTALSQGRSPLTISEEHWVYGLRNPWRFDIDHVGGGIFIGEVGDYLWEEINLAPLSVKGYNFGWPCMEGGFVFPETNEVPQCQSPSLFKRAIHEYPHKDGSGRCAVIGGKVNRPAHNPNDGRYIFTDMCSRQVFALVRDGGGVWQRTLLGVAETDMINIIGEDRLGYLYLGTASESAPIYRLNIP
jgi:glucose/arabinose dehydrogenase